MGMFLGRLAVEGVCSLSWAVVALAALICVVVGWLGGAYDLWAIKTERDRYRFLLGRMDEALFNVKGDPDQVLRAAEAEWQERKNSPAVSAGELVNKDC